MTRATPSNAVLAMSWRKPAFAAAAFALLFGACNSSDDAGPPVPIDDLPRLLADALCNNIGPCCQQAGFPHDAAQCHTTAESEWRTQIDRLRTTNVAYDAGAARSCVNSYASIVQACRPQTDIGSACIGVFVGTQQPGQPCTSSSECAPGSSCTRGGDGGTSQCTPSTTTRVHGKAGDACNATCTTSASGTSTSCSGGGAGGAGADGGQGSPVSCYTNDGLYCGSMRTCATTPSLGQPCTAGAPCAGEAFCDNGVCAAKHTTGTCGQSYDGCAEAAYCDTASRMCQLRKSTGAACTSTLECQTTDSCTSMTCRTRTIASASTCLGHIGQ